VGFITYRAPKTLEERLQDEGKAQNRKRSNMIVWILEQYFSNKKDCSLKS
jgi:predicted DNA-binding protein